MAKSRRCTVESLEDRTAPATFGLPWQDATHLTLSFAPDGTRIAAHQSVLSQTLDRGFAGPADWQSLIVRAFQTWAARTNLSIGLEGDDGDPFGVAGRMQADGRFGDIRVGAHAMSGEVLAVTVPPDPFLSGTLAGDVFLNSSADLGPDNLFAVALHEAGHALGLDHSDDPASAMYERLNPAASLSPGDVAAIQAIYGTRARDRNEPNDGFAAATPISYAATYLGTTPLVAFGDRTTTSDTDHFSFKPAPLYTGPVTIRLQTSGISFLKPRLKIYDQNFNLLGQAQSTSVVGDTLTVRLAGVNPQQRYYVRVDSPARDVSGIGRYALAVTFDNRMVVDPDSLAEVLRGPYDALGSGDIQALLGDLTGTLLHVDLHTNDTFLRAEALPGRSGYGADTRYDVLASLGDSLDVDTYRIRAPQAPAGRTDVLTVTLTQLPINGVLPVVAVFDANAKLVSSQVLLNGNGTYTVQAAGLAPGATYYLRVSAAPAPARAVGNYSLVADFGGTIAAPKTFASDTLPTPSSRDEYSLYVAQSQLFQFVLSTAVDGAAADAQVRLELFDGAGRLVFSLVGRVGQTVSGSSVFLTPGAYRLRFSVVNPRGGAVPPIRYRLFGASISEPTGPAKEDPTMEPVYSSPSDPGVYRYPDGTRSYASYQVSSDKAN